MEHRYTWHLKYSSVAVEEIGRYYLIYTILYDIIFSEGYSFPADIWSCGILVSIMLTGSSPFYHRRELVMLRSIMEGRYSIDGPDWKGISILAKKFIQRLLTLDQHQRITAEEVLSLHNI